MSKSSVDMSALTTKLQNYLEFIANIGFKGVDCSEQTLETLKSWGQHPLKGNESLTDIGNELKQCRKCRLAAEGRAGIMGEGPPGARLMFVGGWPEPGDEASGRPYSGKAGELLGRIIQAMNLNREDVYITHALKCRPPQNTQPKAKDIEICCRFVQREIMAVKPAMIFALGEAAARAMLEDDSPWERLRGRFHDYNNIPVMPTCSPEYLLAQPSAKREAWDDIKRVLQKLKDL
jgi:DNA polymerase